MGNSYSLCQQQDHQIFEGIYQADYAKDSSARTAMREIEE